MASEIFLIFGQNESSKADVTPVEVLYWADGMPKVVWYRADTPSGGGGVGRDLYLLFQFSCLPIDA